MVAAAGVLATLLTGCGDKPAKPAVDLKEAKAFAGPINGVLVASERNDSILVLDPKTLRTKTMINLDSTFPGEKMPHMMAVTPDHKYLLVTEYAFAALAYYDLKAQKMVAEVPVGTNPHGVTISPDGKLAYVAVSGDKSLVAVDIAARKIVNSTQTQLMPWEVVLGPDGKTAWVTSLGADSLLQVDLTTFKPMQLLNMMQESYIVAGALLKDGRLVIGGHSSNKLFVLDGQNGKLLARPEVGKLLPKVGSTGDGGVGYFCQAVLGSGSMPVSIAQMNDKYFVTANHGTNDLAILRTSDLGVEARLPTGADPQDVVVSPDGHYAYVSAGGSGQLWSMDLQTRRTVGRTMVGPRPIGVLYLPA